MLFRSKKDTATPAPTPPNAGAASAAAPAKTSLAPADVKPPATDLSAAAPMLASPPRSLNGAAPPAQSAPIPLSPEIAKQRADQSHRVLGALGAIVTVQMRTPHLRSRTMADLEAIIVPAVATGQFAIAEAAHKQHGFVTPVAYLVWGSFSAENDRQLSAAPEKPFPTAPNDWKGGDIVWIVEATGDQKLVAELIKRQQEGSWKGKTVRMRTAGEGGRVMVSTLTEKPR